jgi:hypothetical protein
VTLATLLTTVGLIGVIGAGCAGVRSGDKGSGGQGGSITGGSGGAAGAGIAGRTGSGGPGGQGVPGVCTGLACAIDKCDGRPKTTVKGAVYDPAGQRPLYNVMVYVPNAALDPIAEGVSCQRCDATASGRPVASALTDPTGRFTMENVPVGTNVPVVIQIGKWRRELRLPEVKACQDNVFDGTETFRLPRDQSEGHLPKIAMTRGGADSLECLMKRIGVADSEFTNPDGAGRVNIFHETGDSDKYSSGATFPPATSLWGTVDTLRKYDMVIMSCHGNSGHGRAQPTAEKVTIKAYLDQGGRVFGSHFHYSLIRGETQNHLPTPFPVIAAWDGENPESYSIETMIPKGEAFADWLVAVGASTVRGTINLMSVEGAAMSLMPGYGQRWIFASNSVPYFSLNTPVEKNATPDEQCGRFVHTGIHINNGSEADAPFPGGCEQRPLTAQEAALEFLIFDLSACIIRDDARPIPPPVVP